MISGLTYLMKKKLYASCLMRHTKRTDLILMLHWFATIFLDVHIFDFLNNFNNVTISSFKNKDTRNLTGFLFFIEFRLFLTP